MEDFHLFLFEGFPYLNPKKKVKDVISGMLADEVPKTELSNPMFYLKTLFS